MARGSSANKYGKTKGIFSKRWKSSSLLPSQREKEQAIFEAGKQAGKESESGFRGAAKRAWKTTKSILQGGLIAAPIAATAYGGYKLHEALNKKQDTPKSQ